MACTVASRACISCSETALMPIFISFQLKLRATGPEAPIPVTITRRALRSSVTASVASLQC